MKCAIVQYHTVGYQELVDLSHPNLYEYCDKHGYLIERTVTPEHSFNLGFRRLQQVLSLFDYGRGPDIAWVLGVDTIIMNHNVKIENRMPRGFDLAIAKDCNDINADSFLIRNCPWSVQFLKEVLSVEEEYMKTQFVEQAAIADAIEKPHNKEHVKVVPQRYLNSYLYADGLNPEWGHKWVDHAGKFGRGDWIIHLPGLHLKTRLETVRKYLPLVVK
jgi:hypothetical protein